MKRCHSCSTNGVVLTNQNDMSFLEKANDMSFHILRNDVSFSLTYKRHVIFLDIEMTTFDEPRSDVVLKIKERRHLKVGKNV